MSTRMNYRSLILSGLLICLAGQDTAQAAQPEVSATAVPVRYVFVDGEAGRFREQHWMSDHYVGGIGDFAARQSYEGGLTAVVDGHALIGDNDYLADILIKKEGFGFVKVDYKSFRKYYDRLGGTFYPFQRLTPDNNLLQRDLYLDIGKLEVETGITVSGLPELSLFYERETKYGAKSRTTWGSATEGGITRKIVPSYQEIDETVNVFGVKGKAEVLGVTATGDQSYELVRAETMREERNLNVNPNPASNTIRRQAQSPDADVAVTNFRLEKWFGKDDKYYASSGYRFYDLDNKEGEDIREFNGLGVLIGSGENKIGATSHNRYHIHTWVNNILAKFWKNWSLNAKTKLEVSNRKASSSYPEDSTSPPDGIINKTEQSVVSEEQLLWGEGASLRYTGIKRAALYAEMELQQGRINQREFRDSIRGQSIGSTGEMFSRDTMVHVFRGSGTVGGQYAPFSIMNLTAHVRRKIDNNDYNDNAESTASAAGARSAFFDYLGIHSNEFAGRASLRPCKWFMPSFRYQLRESDYFTRVENQGDVRTQFLSHVYTFDGTLQLRDNLTTTLSASRNTAVTKTPARFSKVANTPTFHGDVDSWLVNTEYWPCPKVAITNLIELSRAENFNDFTFSGLPLGAQFQELNVVSAVTYTLAKDLSVGLEYGLYSYLPDSRAEAGPYHAHLIRFEVSKKL